MKRGKYTILVFAITISILVFLLLNLLLGSVAIPFRSVWNILTGGEGDPVAWQNIILKSRLPQALTALVAGAGLSISGLQMQTIFRNPLAGPSVLGFFIHQSLSKLLLKYEEICDYAWPPNFDSYIELYF